MTWDLRGSLPAPLTSFVGRVQESERGRALLLDARLVTLVGIGGVGKTRLALRIAESHDQPAFVDLAPVAEDVGVARATVAALGRIDGIVDARADDAASALTDHVARTIGAADVLLVLDNCEQVLDGAAKLALALLSACPNLRILATSREPLSIAGETLYLVPPMGSLSADIEPTVGALAATDAVRLFCQRARSVRPDFVLTDAATPAIVDICQRLEGNPLAIELAAARIDVLGPAQISTRLGDALRLLTGQRRGAPERHQTIDAALRWSYDSLDPSEQTLLQRLAVFNGGWTIEAAEAICGGGPVEAVDVLDLMAGLVRKSLVIADDIDASKRYRMLETLRQFAEGALRDSGDEDSVRHAHVEWFLDEARSVQIGGPQIDHQVLPRLLREVDNFRSALRWSIASGDTRSAMTLATSLHGLFRWIGLGREGETWLTRALESGDRRVSNLTASVLGQLAASAEERGDFARAIVLQTEAAEMFAQRGNVQMVGWCIHGLAHAHYFLGDHHEVEALYNRAHDLLREANDAVGCSWARYNQAWVALVRGDIDTCRTRCAEVLASSSEVSREPRLAVAILQTICDVLEGSRPLVEPGYDDALAQLASGRSHAQRFLVIVAALEIGDDATRDRGIRRLAEALERGRVGGRLDSLPWVLEYAATSVALDGRPIDAARLFGATNRLRREIGLEARWTLFEPTVERARAVIARELGEPTMSAEERYGTVLSLSDALDHAQMLLEETKRDVAMPVTAQHAAIGLDGEYRTITFGSSTFRLKESKGLAYLSTLLVHAGREFHALDLAGVPAGSRLGDAGPLLDDAAKSAYRARIQDLRSEIDDAHSWGHQAQARTLEAELDELKKELSSAVGLGGRDTKAAAASERARSAVTKALRSAMKRIGEHDADLGAHLRATVTTGLFSSYNPDPRIPIVWER